MGIDSTRTFNISDFRLDTFDVDALDNVLTVDDITAGLEDGSLTIGTVSAKDLFGDVNPFDLSTIGDSGSLFPTESELKNRFRLAEALGTDDAEVSTDSDALGGTQTLFRPTVTTGEGRPRLQLSREESVPLRRLGLEQRGLAVEALQSFEGGEDLFNGALNIVADTLNADDNGRISRGKARRNIADWLRTQLPEDISRTDFRVILDTTVAATTA
ncbi:MAG: hypothetical protein AAFN74_09515, partial [Myxococcota bacterium]